MIYNELLKDWVIAGDPGFKPLDLSNGNLHGYLTVGSKKWQVYDLDHHPHHGFGLVVDNKTICFVVIHKWQDPYAMARNAWVDKNFRRQGLATSLMTYIVKNSGYKILSDFEMSTDGEQLWKSIISVSQLDIKILDLLTGNTYDINTAPLKPEDDNGNPPTDVANLKPTDQKMVYLIEKQNKVYWDGISKTKFEFGGPLKPTANSILQEINPFGSKKGSN